MGHVGGKIGLHFERTPTQIVRLPLLPDVDTLSFLPCFRRCERTCAEHDGYLQFGMHLPAEKVKNPLAMGARWAISCTEDWTRSLHRSNPRKPQLLWIWQKALRHRSGFISSVVCTNQGLALAGNRMAVPAISAKVAARLST
jgi:hypothetical protein